MTRWSWYVSHRMGREEFWREVEAALVKVLPVVALIAALYVAIGRWQ